MPDLTTHVHDFQCPETVEHADETLFLETAWDRGFMQLTSDGRVA